MAGYKNTYRYRQGDEFPLDEIYAIQGLGGGDWWEKISDGARDLDMSDICRCTRDIKITVVVY